MVLEIFINCVLFGGIAGVLAGLFGIGGGVVLVPFFVWLFARQGISTEHVMVISVATSLATIVVTSVAAVLAHQRMKAVMWPVVWGLVPGILIGAVLGAVIAGYIPGQGLRLIFAFFMLYVGFKMALPGKADSGQWRKSRFFYIAAGHFIGLFSALLGIGGGTLSVPILVKTGMQMRYAVAVSSACGLPIAVSGTLSYIVLGWSETDMHTGFLGYVYLPAFFGIILTSILAAPLGAKLAQKLPTQSLKRYFSVLVFIVAIKFLYSIYA